MVPAPMSMSSEPSSRSSGVSTASAVASGSKTISTTSMPARLTQVSRVLRARDVAGHQVDHDLEPAAQHAERVVDAALLVDHELLRDGVQDLAVGGQGRRLRRLEHALDVLAGDLAVLARHRDHAARVDAADVGAGDADVGARDLDAGHHLGLLARRLERLDRGLDVDDVALARAAVGGQALADHLDAALVVALADEHPHLGGADVDADEVRFWFGHAAGPSSSEESALSAAGGAAVRRRMQRAARRSGARSAGRPPRPPGSGGRARAAAPPGGATLGRTSPAAHQQRERQGVGVQAEVAPRPAPRLRVRFAGPGRAARGPARRPPRGRAATPSGARLGRRSTTSEPAAASSRRRRRADRRDRRGPRASA